MLSRKGKLEVSGGTISALEVVGLGCKRLAQVDEVPVCYRASMVWMSFLMSLKSCAKFLRPSLGLPLANQDGAATFVAVCRKPRVFVSQDSGHRRFIVESLPTGVLDI